LAAGTGAPSGGAAGTGPGAGPGRDGAALRGAGAPGGPGTHLAGGVAERRRAGASGPQAGVADCAGWTRAAVRVRSLARGARIGGRRHAPMAALDDAPPRAGSGTRPWP